MSLGCNVLYLSGRQEVIKMVQRCRNCGEKIIRFPIWKGQEKGEPFGWDKIIWVNLFKVDVMSIIWFFVVIFLIISYRTDISKCDEMMTHPLRYCEESNACKILEERRLDNPYGIVDLDDIPDFNMTDFG